MNDDIQELLERAQNDFDMRTKGRYDESIDRSNIVFLRSFVEKYGWPRISEFGEEVANGAWLIVQHGGCDDPEFQKKCLVLMKELQKEKDVDCSLIAYLEDRVRVVAHQSQLYGTQLTPKDGLWVPKPIENEEAVDARRAQIGLEPMAEYIFTMNQNHKLS